MSGVSPVAGAPFLLRLLRWRWLHFVVAGGALFAMRGGFASPPAEEPGPVREELVVEESTLRALRADHLRSTGAAPTPTEAEARLVGWVEDEILFREALALGLNRSTRQVRLRLIDKMRFLGAVDDARPLPEHELYERAVALGLDRSDPIIRRMLIENMRLALAHSERDESPEDAVLEDYLVQHRPEFEAPRRVSFSHVFLGDQTRGPELERAARELQRRLRAEALEPPQAESLGDHFFEGSSFVRQAPADLARVFGRAFAEAAGALPSRVWSEPIRSPYGTHLVWIDRVEAAHPLSLREARSQVLARWRAERAEERMRRAIRALRDRYAVRIDTGAGQGANAVGEPS